MPGSMYLLIAVLAAFVVTALLTRRFCDPSSRLHLLDHPNERSLHSQPTPRTGGVAMAAGLATGTGLLALSAVTGPPWYGFGGGALLVAALSFLDDRYGLPVRVRLPGHLVAAVLAMIGGLHLSAISLPGVEWQLSEWLGVTASVLFLVWMINLYNFMDGMDGLAAGMAVIGFSTFALLGLASGNMGFVAINFVIGASAAGFLVFNFPPARIFMGDTGSALLGLLAGGFSLWGVHDGIFPVWIALLVFSPFIVDATVTLVRRLLNRERVWEAHKTHYYQRLVQSGWGHRKTVLHEYGLMLACSGSALVAQRLDAQAQGILCLGWCLAYPLLMAAIHRREKRKASS